MAINHILPETRFFGYIRAACREYRSNFNQFDVIGPKAAEFGKITKNNHYAVQCHSRSHITVRVESPCDFLLANNTNWQSYFALFPSYCWWQVQFSLSTAEGVCLSLTHSQILDCEIWPQETSYRDLIRSVVWCKAYFDTSNRLVVTHEWTDTRTDIHYHSKCRAAALRCAAKMVWWGAVRMPLHRVPKLANPLIYFDVVLSLRFGDLKKNI